MSAEGGQQVRNRLLAAIILVAIPDIAAAECRGYAGPGGPCYAGPGGGLYAGPGGGLYAGPGGGLYAGPGGGMYAGPSGGLYKGPGGGLYSGPGGGIYQGPPGGPDAYRGPWGPCITGAKGPEWTAQNCPD